MTPWRAPEGARHELSMMVGAHSEQGRTNAGEKAISLLFFVLFLSLFLCETTALAEVTAEGRATLFYTDDVALFSATRRLSVHGDPTQPALDTSLTGKGSDMVFEPDLIVSKLIASSWGKTTLSVKAQGFIFAVNPRFNQASVGLQALHSFTPDTAIRLRYYTAPDQLLGDNEERRSGTHSLQEERVTSHVGSIRFEQRLSENWELRILGRVGAREYNEAFAQRDTTFWTIGPHLDWRVAERLKLFLGYHYERGLADGRNQPQFEDDTSYVNHFVSLGLEAQLLDRLEMELGFHFERNNWTSAIEGDERHGAHETIVQGEMMFFYRLTDQARLTCAFQRSQRRQSFEQESVFNTNVSVGASYRF
ncbi:hypothetical protein ACO9S2_02005 [Nitrospira sp. NS4]|uniref:hypothetical protein n=1 Tax=Nitrospira sp. NS4 TaxID=3414498 RepID=UPI003C2B8395